MSKKFWHSQNEKHLTLDKCQNVNQQSTCTNLLLFALNWYKMRTYPPRRLHVALTPYLVDGENGGWHASLTQWGQIPYTFPFQNFYTYAN